MGIRLSYGKNSPCEKCEDKTTVNWAQLSNEYRANESGDSGDSGDSSESGESGESDDFGDSELSFIYLSQKRA